jgi:hypothetical protein
MNITPEQCKSYFDSQILPILNRFGCIDYHLDPEAHLNVLDGQTFYPLNFRFFGKVVNVCGSGFNPEKINWLLSNFTDLENILKHFENVEAPFHSEIYAQLKSVKNYSKVPASRTSLAYSFLCEQIRQSGKTIFD